MALSPRIAQSSVIPVEHMSRDQTHMIPPDRPGLEASQGSMTATSLGAFSAALLASLFLFLCILQQMELLGHNFYSPRQNELPPPPETRIMKEFGTLVLQILCAFEEPDGTNDEIIKLCEGYKPSCNLLRD